MTRKHREPDDASEFLAENAGEIRRLAEEVVRVMSTNVPEIGRRLVACRDRLPHRHWMRWLEVEFQWSSRTARNYIGVYEAQRSGKLEKFSSLKNIDLSALFLLAAPSTPKEVVDDAIEEERRGGRVTHRLVRNRLSAARQRSTASTQEAPAEQAVSGTTSSGEVVQFRACVEIPLSLGDPNAMNAADAPGPQRIGAEDLPPPTPKQRADIHRALASFSQLVHTHREEVLVCIRENRETAQWYYAELGAFLGDTGGA